MASKTNYSILILSLFFFLSMLNLAIASNNVSAIFAFGDSTIDAGNNNHLGTFFRVDHFPYGRDFPTHLPTGRFSNGKITTDYLAQILGIKELLPAFLDPQVTDKDLITGVTFASGGSGLDSNTAALFRALDLVAQFELFEEALMRIRNVVGNEKANDIIHDALFVICTGMNDFLSPTRVSHYGSISDYQDFLLQNLQSFIQRLYGAGGRRIVVAGLPPIGCLPIQVTVDSIIPSPHCLQRVCNDKQNMDSQTYNAKLQSHIHLLHQTTLPDAKIAYFDMYSLFLDMIISPAKYGFFYSLEGCCGTGLLEMGLVCNSLDIICRDPSKYLFWDAMHPTQKVHWLLANSCRQTLLPYLTSIANSLQGCCGTGLLEMGPMCNLLDIICLDPSKYLFWDAMHPTQKGNWHLANSVRQTVLHYALLALEFHATKYVAYLFMKKTTTNTIFVLIM